MPNMIYVLLLIGAAVAAVPYLESYTEAQPTPEPARAGASGGSAPRMVSLKADGRGHFVVKAVINGRTIEMLADTGASAVVLTQEDARRAGFDPRSLSYDVPVRTGNGETRAAAVQLDSVDVGGIRLSDVKAMVAGPDELHISLLGMSFIGRLSEFSMAGGRLDLVK